MTRQAGGHARVLIRSIAYPPPQAFQSLGSCLGDHVEVQRVEPAAYRVVFGDSSHLDLLYDVQQMMTQLEGVEKGAGR